MFEDKSSLTLVCPNCRHIFQESISELKLKDAVICRRCARVFLFDQAQFRVALEEARTAFRELKKSLGLTK